MDRDEIELPPLPPFGIAPIADEQTVRDYGRDCYMAGLAAARAEPAKPVEPKVCRARVDREQAQRAMTDDEIDAAIRAIVPAECFRANAVAREIYRAGYLAGYEAGIALTPHLPWSPEETARRFHDAYEELAPTFGYSTRPESRVSWDRLSEPMRSLMIATVRAVFIERAADALDGGQR